MAKQRSKEFLNSDFDAFMQELLAEFKIPGASVATINGDEIEAKGYGMTRLGGPPVNSDTIMYSASMSKSFTAGAIGLLIQDEEEKKSKDQATITWDMPVSSLIRDDFVLSDTYSTEHTTVVDMLTHRTGEFGHDAASHGVTSATPDTLRSITRKLRHFPTQWPFRTKWDYNNMMYTAVSYLVEVLSGKDFYSYLKTNFWAPLGMTRTFGGIKGLPGGTIPADSKALDDLNIAMPHICHKETEKLEQIPYLDAPEGTGAGNILSSATDWAKWLHSMINHSNALSSSTIEELFTPYILRRPKPVDKDGNDKEPLHSPAFQGMGWAIEYYHGHKVVGHAGGVPGFSCLMRYLPEKKFGCVVFGNSGGMDSASEPICWRLIDECLGVPEKERLNWVKMAKEDEDDDEEEGGSVWKDRAEPKLELPVELERLAGTYAHPGHGEFKFEVEGNALVADARDRTFGYWLRLRRVSALLFEAEIDELFYDSSKVEAEFKLGVDGQVIELGIDFVDEDESEMIWFSREVDS